jgi:hypothetical protein
MSPEARLDMSDRNVRGKTGERRAECARRVALDDKQVRVGGKERKERGGDLANVVVRILFARAIEPKVAEWMKPKLMRVEPGVLAGEDKGRSNAPRSQRVGKGR